MPIEDSSEPLLAADLSIEVSDVGGKTMTVHRIRQNGKLKFDNKNQTRPLMISSPAAEPPFIVDGEPDAVSWFVVDADDKEIVTIAPAYVVGTQFTYSAQVNGTTPEDPIVIVDRR